MKFVTAVMDKKSFPMILNVVHIKELEMQRDISNTTSRKLGIMGPGGRYFYVEKRRFHFLQISLDIFVKSGLINGGKVVIVGRSKQLVVGLGFGFNMSFLLLDRGVPNISQLQSGSLVHRGYYKGCVAAARGKGSSCATERY